MIHHEFIFQPGRWIGEGRIAFSATEETIRFYTRWISEKGGPGGISCTQDVEMQGAEPATHNFFIFYNLTSTSFEISLENEIVGVVKGKGVIDDKIIAWEFHQTGGLEGFESYQLQENGDYMFHAEYSSQDQFRTIIDGRVWKKAD
jgi:hypothetical protein